MDVREKAASEKRLIDADALIHRLLNTKIVAANLFQYANAVTNMIGDAPTIEAEPVRHGRWLHTEEPLGWKDVDCMECSACHDSWIIEEDYCFDDMKLWNYCPSCGAKMDGGED